MSRYIRLDDAIETLKENVIFEFTEDEEWAITCLQNLPSADRPKGKWIYGEHDVAMCDGYRCDRCGFFVPWDYEHKSIDFIDDYNFCPYCGSDMRGDNNEAD